MSKRIQFSYQAPGGDRRHFISQQDVDIVISRLPSELVKRVTHVRLLDRSRGRRVLGYTTTRGRREIAICALPPRISLTKALRPTQSAEQFGAIRGTQWPTLAIRRFLLYDVLLHEIGHLQIIDEKAGDHRRKFADETRAQDFAEYWSEELLNTPFEHPDPVHQKPSQNEIQDVIEKWPRAHAEYKKGLRSEGRAQKKIAVSHYAKALEIWPFHEYALEAMGIFAYANTKSAQRALGFLSKAVQRDPGLVDANIFLGLAYADLKQKDQSLRYLEAALHLRGNSTAILSLIARVYADFEEFQKAESMALRSLKRNPGDPFVQYNFQRVMTHERNPNRRIYRNKYQSLFHEDLNSMLSERYALTSRGLRVFYTYDL